ncbi:ChrR family anti-sigma-E factor [Neptuniibacter halophilus]|uniref:ChrR family anti-sigma-E factor n=1 Tax=Neptuniibacter halophilus TaxID=651666 RepID=UPI0025733C0D|nr:ChrR family anti-sigma-E factor [Neptuniibacter halophilus]
MNIKHHLDEATLVSYAAGAISQSMALVVASHISLCPSCRQRVAQAESIGGLLLDQMQQAEIRSDAMEQALAALDGVMPESVSAREPISTVRREPGLPAPLFEQLGCNLDQVNWKRLVPGVYYHDLPCKSERGGVSRLMRIAPGKGMLPHTHDGNELTLVLQGSFCDEVGRFSAGDVADLDSEIEHQPLVDSDEDCICLIATDAPLKFSTLLGRVVQPFTGF